MAKTINLFQVLSLKNIFSIIHLEALSFLMYIIFTFWQFSYLKAV